MEVVVAELDPSWKVVETYSFPRLELKLYMLE
jgi:hypothetical protein